MAKRVSTRDAAASASVPAPKTTRTRTRAKKAAEVEVPVETVATAAVSEVPAPVMAETATVSGTAFQPENSFANTAETAATTGQIAQLAYYFWLQRGCPISSGEEDWYRAERELSRHAIATA